MRWIRIISGALVLAMGASATPTQASAISDCRVPPGAVKVSVPSGLPPSLRNALPGDIALPGEPFDETDIYVKRHKHSRYLFVWNVGTQWIVATEEGGRALHAAIFTYDLGKDDKTAVLIEEQNTFLTSVCAAATNLVERH
jgi:hypothetical protein